DGRGLDGARHVLDELVRLTARDAMRRGCLVWTPIPGAHALSADTRREMQAALDSMQALLRARVREAQADAGTSRDLEPLVAVLFAAVVAIRVLGRAGQERRLLRHIAGGALETAERWVDHGKEETMPIDHRERARRRALLHTHYAAENRHDLDGIMATFSARGEMMYNHQSFATDETIRWAHGYIGMSAAPGAFGGLRAIIDREHFTDEETVVEGRLLGAH